MRAYVGFPPGGEKVPSLFLLTFRSIIKLLKIIPYRWNKEGGVGDTCIPRALLAAPFGPCTTKITRHKLVSLFKMPFRYTFSSYFVKSESCCNEEWRVKLLFVETIVLQSVSKFVSDKVLVF